MIINDLLHSSGDSHFDHDMLPPLFCQTQLSAPQRSRDNAAAHLLHSTHRPNSQYSNTTFSLVVPPKASLGAFSLPLWTWMCCLEASAVTKPRLPGDRPSSPCQAKLRRQHRPPAATSAFCLSTLSNTDTVVTERTKETAQHCQEPSYHRLPKRWSSHTPSPRRFPGDAPI